MWQRRCSGDQIEEMREDEMNGGEWHRAEHSRWILD